MAMLPPLPVATSVGMPRTKSPWLQFFRRRLIGLVGVLFVLVVGTFAIVQLIPGDPAQTIAGQGATAERIQRLRSDLGLDLPLWEQFTNYVGGVFTGDLGESFQYNVPVTDLLADRLPFTAQLALFGIIVVLLVAVPLGMAIAVACRGGRRKTLDSTFTAVTAIGGSIPEYVLATVLVATFAVSLGWFPSSGAASFSALILPVAAISLGPISALARIVRRESAVVLGQDYLRTARGRRLSAWRLYTRHALPNLLTSTLTLGGLVLASMLGGAVIVEIVFAFPGLGTLIITAMTFRDYPVIQGSVLVLGVLATIINLLVDVILGLIDRRTLTGKAGLQ